MHKALVFRMTADLKPLPSCIGQIKNADVVDGEHVGTFKVWPTAHPEVLLEADVPLTISLRVCANQPEVMLAAGRALGDNPGTASPSSFPAGRIGFKKRLTLDPDIYWLDITMSAPFGAGKLTWSLDLPEDRLGHKLRIDLSASVVKDSLLTTPALVDMGEISLRDLSAGPVRAGRAGIRRLFGSFHLKGVRSSLPCVQVTVRTLVAGKNYLLELGVASSESLKPGSLAGTITVDTDDAKHPSIQIPFKLTIVP